MIEFKKCLLEDRKRWILWLPVFFGIGTISYFSITFEPEINKVSLILLVTLSAAFLFLKKNLAVSTFLFVLSLTISAFLSAAIHANLSKTPVIEDNLGTIWVRATIEEVEKKTYGHRLMLTDLDLWKPETKRFPKSKTPEKIRVNVRTKLGNAAPGDRISFRSILSPPPGKPAYPRSYDFARFAYFEQIGAVGYSLSDIKIMEKAAESGFSELVSNIRKNITDNILENLDNSEAGNIATALITGQKGGISNKTLEDMRRAGLGHLLAISGLHMALVMATCFFAFRALLALSQQISLRFNIKKLAAYLALAAGFFYLLISGMPVSAKRAYIMAGLFFITILLDRTGTPMRPIAWAAIIVMLVDPLAITGPSFQMSFAASVALIAAYERFTLINFDKIKVGGIFYKLKIYVLGVAFSSLVAGLSTAPFAIYHFGRFANYGLIANLIAIPMTSFLILPLGIIAILLMPLGLEKMALYPMSYGIDIVTGYAAFIDELPYSSVSLSDISPWAIATLTIGGLWLVIWQSKIRYIGLLPMVIGLVFIIFPKTKPDIIIDGSGKLFAIQNENEELVFSSLGSARFSRKEWLKVAGQEESLSLKKSPPSENLECDSSSCSYFSKGYMIVFLKSDIATNDHCKKADIFINLTDKDINCQEIEISSKILYKISLADLHKNGTYVIWLDDPLKVTSVELERGQRLWNSRR